MTRTSPAEALNGVQPTHACNCCNKHFRTGVLVRARATYCEEDGWILQQIWCENCADSVTQKITDRDDEAIIGAIFWNRRLTSVKTKQNSSK